MLKTLSSQVLGSYLVAKGSIRTSPKQKGNMRGDIDTANATHFLLCHIQITVCGFNFGFNTPNIWMSLSKVNAP